MSERAIEIVREALQACKIEDEILWRCKGYEAWADVAVHPNHPEIVVVHLSRLHQFDRSDCFVLAFGVLVSEAEGKTKEWVREMVKVRAIAHMESSGFRKKAVS